MGDSAPSPRELRPASAAEVAETVRGADRLLPVGGRSKPGLSLAAGDLPRLDLSAVRGILAYDPAELTFTALAGTPVAEVEAALAEHGQFLPFDPPFAEGGATLGGAVASGIAGSGRQRYGGVRDFLIGVALVDGTGALVRGGGKVVKNAAGFDLPKLMVGSMGTLGVLVELTFKVFPGPATRTTLRFDAAGFQQARGWALRLAGAPLDLEALDLAPAAGGGWLALVRLGGPRGSLEARARRVESLLGVAARRIDAEGDAELWRSCRELEWVGPDRDLVRVPISPRVAPRLEAALAGLAGASAADRRYAAGCSVAWIACPRSRTVAELERVLAELGLVGQVVLGTGARAILGAIPGAGFARRLRSALDPGGRFPALDELRGAAPASAIHPAPAEV
ncbi:MAG TPA: FAD-binding protein [Thermoanaerobaculia bacterium]|nr:FAD-binding protein [Thermoanaerobaculia bacterium]